MSKLQRPPPGGHVLITLLIALLGLREVNYTLPSWRRAGLSFGGLDYIAMCELGSLQSDWPVAPPSALTCRV